MDKDLLVLIKDGKEERFYKIGEFNSILTKKDYIVYTDNNYTDGKINIFCSVLNEKDGKILYTELDETDRKEFEKALKEFEKMAK